MLKYYRDQPQIDTYLDSEDYNDRYNVPLTSLPLWFRYFVEAFISVLGTLGLLLNGFVIWCYFSKTNVSQLYLSN